MASTFIEHLLPPENDPNRAELEVDARKVCAQSYFGGCDFIPQVSTADIFSQLVPSRW
jgi:hypothetical protein